MLTSHVANLLDFPGDPTLPIDQSALTMSGILNQGLLLVRDLSDRAAADAAAAAAPLAQLPQQSWDLSTYPTTPLQQFGLFILIFFPAVSVLLVSPRLYDRIQGNAFGLDDAFISLATVCLPG